tara:strand:- start:222 stop:359 length:138 start_codon:yes stop_codon:yes gene_type:complete
MDNDKKKIGAGKGDKPRPRNLKSYDKGYDVINWKNTRKEKPKARL